jgi:DNA-binding NtrC family response regulator
MDKSSLKRVLILEENTDHLELLTSILEEHFSPIDIHTVETIEDCLDFLDQTSYDIVLTGCYIHTTCISERLKDIVSAARGTPVIVISGKGDESMAALAIKLGASEYLVKNRKSMEKIPALFAKYFKRSSAKSKVPQRPATESLEQTGRIIRELDHLMQRARTITTNVALKGLPEDSSSLDAVFGQIQRLRKLLQERK